MQISDYKKCKVPEDLETWTVCDEIRSSKPMKPPRFNSSPLKIDDWKTIVSFMEMPMFRGYVKFRGVLCGKEICMNAKTSQNHYNIMQSYFL